jgi:hypothetical protein
LTLPGLELQPLFIQPVAGRHTDCAIPARLIQVSLKNRTTSIVMEEDNLGGLGMDGRVILEYIFKC